MKIITQVFSSILTGLLLMHFAVKSQEITFKNDTGIDDENLKINFLISQKDKPEFEQKTVDLSKTVAQIPNAKGFQINSAQGEKLSRQIVIEPSKSYVLTCSGPTEMKAGKPVCPIAVQALDAPQKSKGGETKTAAAQASAEPTSPTSKDGEAKVAAETEAESTVPVAPPMAPPLETAPEVVPPAPPLAPTIEAPSLGKETTAPKMRVLKKVPKQDKPQTKAQPETTGPKVSAKLDPESGELTLVVTGQEYDISDMKAPEQVKFIEGLDTATLSALPNKILEAVQELTKGKNTAIQSVFNMLENAYKSSPEPVKLKFKALLVPLYQGMELTEEEQVDPKKAMGFEIAKKSIASKFNIAPQAAKVTKVLEPTVNIKPAFGKKSNVSLKVDTTVIDSAGLKPEEFADKFAALSDKDRNSLIKDAVRKIKDAGTLINLNVAFKPAYDSAKPEAKKIISDFILKLIKTINENAVRNRIVMPIDQVVKIAAGYNITLAPEVTAGLAQAAATQAQSASIAKLKEGYDQSKFGNFKLEFFKVLLEDEKLKAKDIQKIAFDNNKSKNKLLEKLPNVDPTTIKNLSDKLVNIVKDERDLLYLYDMLFPDVYGEAKNETREVIRSLLREIITSVTNKKQMKTLTDQPNAIINLITKDFRFKLQDAPTEVKAVSPEKTHEAPAPSIDSAGAVPVAPPL